jgi:hypothetical protein
MSDETSTLRPSKRPSRQTLPFGHDHLVLVLLGMAELGLGTLLISGAFLRLALLAVGLHLAGTFSTFAMAPALMFSDSNPLLLTADGEFVAKNSVLIAAALVLITHTSPSTADSAVPVPENPIEAPEAHAPLQRLLPEE